MDQSEKYDFDESEEVSEREKVIYEQVQNDLFVELNRLRRNPKCYIPLVKDQMEKLKGNTLCRKNHMVVQTAEGRQAYEEAIEFLEEQESVELLKRESCLTKAAIDLVNDIGPRGVVTHQDSRGNFVSERIEKYCEWDFCANECIEISSRNAIDILIDLIVDDGIPERLDRKALFQHIYNYVGFGCGPHREYGMVTVVVLVGSIRPKGSLFYQYDLKNKEIEKEQPESRSIVNYYQINDPDAPDNTIGLRLVKTQKKINDKIILVTKKFYKLRDGTEHVVELEEY